MRLHLLVAAAALSLVGCTFDPAGLGAESTGAPETTTGMTTEVDTTVDPTTEDPTTGGDLCGNYSIDAGEQCDGGPSNGTMGVPCKLDCTLNVCGDGYKASTEGCDDGNSNNDDLCSNDCILTGCGDGVLGPGEECDDGNLEDGDGCSKICREPFCGDASVDPGEECDGGAASNGDTKACTSMCKNAVCGDTLVWEGMEACDDGNDVNTDDCTDQCTSADCGDGAVQPGEECDDANDVDTDACTNICKDATCGDMIVGPDEDCDDANVDDTDACTNACKNATCGDGIEQAGVEQCDDANASNTDACVADCKDATCGDGFVLMGTEDCDGGDKCDANCKVKLCGNGMKDAGEECDDGDSDDADTCGNDCVRNGYMVFVTNAKSKGGFGGLTDADDLCNTAATTGKLFGAGKFKAWLSDDMTSADDRLADSALPYLRTDNAKVADDWTDLTDNSLDAPINHNESNNPVGNGTMCNSGESLVWTNTSPTGAEGGEHCNKWTDSGGGMNGRVGLATVINGMWTDACTVQCNTSARIYCVEQP